MSEDDKSKALGRFKARFLELEEPINHTLTHQSVCALVNEAKQKFPKIHRGKNVQHPLSIGNVIRQLNEIEFWFEEYFGSQ